MEISVYTLTFMENSDYRCDARSEVFATHADAYEAMKDGYESSAHFWGLDKPYEEDDDHYNCINDDAAVICAGMDSCSWEINEHIIDVPFPTGSEAAHA